MSSEINVTVLINSLIDGGELRRMCFVASVAERGPTAGPDTYAAACSEAEEMLPSIWESPGVLDPDIRKELIEHFGEYGAWSREELEGYSHTELAGMLVQDVTHDWREHDYLDDEESEEGRGRIFQGDDGTWYFYVGT